MKAYAFPVEPDDINNVLLELRNIGAGWGRDRDPVDYFNTHVYSDQISKEGIALYISEVRDRYTGGFVYYDIMYSSVSYLKTDFRKDYGYERYTVVDSFYSIPEFATYSDLAENTINFCDI
jgi:hypothetical protein